MQGLSFSVSVVFRIEGFSSSLFGLEVFWRLHMLFMTTGASSGDCQRGLNLLDKLLALRR